EHTGRRGERVLVEEVVLDGPHAVKPEPVGQLDLLQRLFEGDVGAVVVPRARNGEVVHEAELHEVTPAAEPVAEPRCTGAGLNPRSNATSQPGTEKVT